MAGIMVVAHEVEDIGIDSSSYFTGRGTSYSRWDQVSVGIGSTGYEACEDALEGLAQMGYDVDDIDNPFTDENADYSVELCWAHDPRFCPLADDYEFDDDDDFDPDDLTDDDCNCEFSEESELWYHVAVYIEELDGTYEQGLELWKEFGETPIYIDSEETAIDFLHFPAGTDRYEIWHWFENTFDNFVIGDIRREA